MGRGVRPTVVGRSMIAFAMVGTLIYSTFINANHPSGIHFVT